LSLSNNNEEILITKQLLEKHQFEAQMFFIKKPVKNLVKIDSKVCAISLDYEKN
jgi:hypothetical protein